MLCADDQMTGSMQRIFSRSPDTTSLLGPESSRRRSRRVYTKRSRAGTGSIKVSSYNFPNKQELNDLGTWIPLGDGRNLAEKNGTLDRIIKIFDFVPGDRSPPPAPKHATAASNKPKTNRQPVPPRKPPVQSKYPRLNGCITGC